MQPTKQQSLFSCFHSAKSRPHQARCLLSKRRDNDHTNFC
jgi:hypothetical protein